MWRAAPLTEIASMMLLIVGLIAFLGIHLLPTMPEVRDGLRQRFGESVYKGVFTLLSLVSSAVIVLGYHKMQLHPRKNPVLWDPPVWTHHLAATLMLPATILVVASNVPSRIRNWAQHPMLLAIMLWALAHLLANGDLASLLLFGSFLAYAIYDRISVKKRGVLGPLGEATPTSARNELIVVGAGLTLYAALLFGGHQWLIGVAPLPELSPAISG